MSMNNESDFVNTESWNLFRNRFRSAATEASYLSDIREFCRVTGKPVSDANRKDVQLYYEIMKKKLEEGKLMPITVTKKFRELHSFTQFLREQKGGSDKMQEDWFYLYLKNMEGESELARNIPVEDMDALLQAAATDRMAYTILTLMYRAGLSSTEIISLNGENDFIKCDEGLYVILTDRKEVCYIPEDAERILTGYMEQREIHDSLFYNRSGRRLNGMYISRMMKRYCTAAGVRSYSAEAVRNSCAFNLFAFGADPSQVAGQMGRTEQQIRRYRGAAYRRNLQKKIGDLVKVRIEEP